MHKRIDFGVYETECKGCGKKFLTSKRNKFYCRVKCRQVSAKNAMRVLTGKAHFVDDSISTSTIGAIHELAVCVDLMRRGFHVFRAQSPNCPCDLICLDGKDAKRIEVRTGRKTDDGKPTNVSKPELGLFDILAVVMYDGEIIYQDSELNVISMIR